MSEGGNSRISAFDTTGPSFLHAFGWNVDPGLLPGGFQVCDAVTTCKQGSAGNGDGQLSSPQELAFAGGRLYVAEGAANNRVGCFGEPSTPMGPCAFPVVPPKSPPATPPPTAPIAAPLPSNAFTLGKLKRKKKKGIGFLFVSLPGPGELGLQGKGLKAIDLAVGGGTAKLKVAPKKKGKRARKIRRALLDKGKAKVKALVTFVPTGGVASTQARKLKLVKRPGR